MISIIDCQMGNIGSIVNIIKNIGCEAKVISTPEEILEAKKLIFPGVGHWDNGVEMLNKSGLRPAILKAINELNIPFMGICLGMQLLFESSDEGLKAGLGLIPGHVKKFDFNDLHHDFLSGSNRLRIPHMGWNDVKASEKIDEVFNFRGEDLSFYFVHSYHVSNVPKDYQLLVCHYGYDFVCGVNKNNVWGFQFHPEKSHKFGMQLFKKFAGIS